MSASASQSLSNFHLLFHYDKECAKTETMLGFISHIRDNDHINRVGENNWQCLWYNKTFQGIIDTKALAHILDKKGIPIKSCYAYMEKAHITR